MTRSRFQEYRDRLRGGPARVLRPCGTLAAARRHQRHGEPLDDACRAALAKHAREQYRKRNAPPPPHSTPSDQGEQGATTSGQQRRADARPRSRARAGAP